MKYYYNSYRINWADEANFYGFELIDETEIQQQRDESSSPFPRL